VKLRLLEMSLSLSAPQSIFLNDLDTKFRAYVGGFGCVRGDTLIHTEFGLRRIDSITSPIRVLSWNQKNQEFQLSLSGGAFPKGRANLYRVSTQQGEFVSSGHHLVFSSDDSYRRVDSLSVGDGLNFVDQSRLSTKMEFDQLSYVLDDRHCSQTNVDLMGRYADEARLYGQRFLKGQEAGSIYAPLQSDAQEFDPCSYSEDNELGGGSQEREPSHSRLSRWFYQIYKRGYLCRLLGSALVLASQMPALFFERISDYLQKSKLFPSTFLPHRNTVKYSSVERSCSSPIKSTKIINIEKLGEDVYYDMQVLDTNNYVTDDGCIHHNSGKTYVGCLDLLIFFCKHPGTRQGYFGPTYPSIRDIFYPTFDEAAQSMGFTCDIKESNKEVHLYRNGSYYGTVICRSMDRPESIIGFKIARALVDEIDTLPLVKAERAWNKIIARMRLVIDGVENSIGVTTTPEGFLFVYDRFKKNTSKSYSMVQASTYENEEFLPPDYIDSLIETYDSNLIKAYLSGEFVNLTSGSVYPQFDRNLNNSDAELQPTDALYIGMDFNVGNMSGVVHIIKDGDPIAVDEIVGAYDTPDIIQQIKKRYWNESSHNQFLKTCNISIYPDSSGDSRKTVNAGETDIQLLKQAGFHCAYNPSNPRVRDRINSMNRAFCDNDGYRKYKVNTKKCKVYTEDLEQQVYADNGEPDKSAGKDHRPDAGGYFIAHEYPIIRPITTKKYRMSY